MAEFYLKYYRRLYVFKMSNYRIPKMIETIQQSFRFILIFFFLSQAYRKQTVLWTKKKKSLNYSGEQAQKRWVYLRSICQ